MLAANLGAEDLLTNQPGTAVPAGDWTDVTSTLNGLAGSTIPYYNTDYDKGFYVPAISSVCYLGSYWEPSSEPNRNWSCYRWDENRWFMVDMMAPFHNEHLGDAGHPMGYDLVDPTTSVSAGGIGGSGSQVQEILKWGNWRYDFVGQVGIPQQTPQGPTIANQLGTCAYDTFDKLLICFGGDSSSQGHYQFDNNASHSVCGTNGVSCYNTYSLEMSGVALNGLPISLELHSMSLNTTDKKTYLFGGFATSAAHNWVWTYTPGASGTAGTWTNIFADATTSASCHDSAGGNNCPAARVAASFAYDSSDNTFLIFGGCDNPAVTGCTGMHQFSDTWVFDPVALTWTQQNPTHIPILTAGIVPNERLTYIPEDNVYWLAATPGGTANLHIWIYRKAPGSKAGWRSKSYTYTAVPPSGATTVGPLSRNTISAGAQAHVYASEIASDGTNLYVTHTETGTAQTGAAPTLLHPFTQKFSSGGSCGSLDGNYNCLGSLYSSMSPDVGGNQRQAFDISCAVISGNPWCAWYEEDASLLNYVYVKGWNGSWSLGGLVPNNTGTAYGGPTKVIGVGSTPTIIMTEQSRKFSITAATSANPSVLTGVNDIATGPGVTISGATGCWAVLNNSGNPQTLTVVTPGSTFNVAKDTSACNQPLTGTVTAFYGNPAPQYCYVEQWNGSFWAVLGITALNTGFTVCDSPSIATDGTNVWAAFTVYGPVNSASANNNGVWIGPPQVQLWKWNGSTWAQQGGSGNVLGSGCTGMLSGANPPVYAGTGCSRAYNTSLTVMGGIPYVAFVERTDTGIIQKLWVRSYNGGWSTVGSTYLNRDTLNGWAFKPDITNDGTRLLITWAEQGNPQTWVGTFAYPANSAYNQKPHVYAAGLTTGGSLTYLGGALNADTTYGSATRPSITVFNSQPVVAWGEIQLGSLRQVYVKQWDGTDWGSVGSSVLSISPATLPGTTVSATYSQGTSQWVSRGTPPYGSYAIASGALPAGLTLNSSTGLISGTVGAPAGVFAFTESVSDSTASSATSGAVSITVNASPSITTGTPLPPVTAGASYSQQISETGGTGPLNWSVAAGTLAGSGLTLNSAGLVSGIALAPAATYTFTAEVTDSAGVFAQQTFSVTVAGASNTCISPCASGNVQIQGKVSIN
ncbi:MAG TPA: Ig domain-containing protein [Bryobacteraceae bacterium]|nr:Ig domain-containing protein [Bryobacteraceae bacterium]